MSRQVRQQRVCVGEDIHRAAAPDGDFDVAGFVEVHP